MTATCCRCGGPGPAGRRRVCAPCVEAATPIHLRTVYAERMARAAAHPGDTLAPAPAPPGAKWCSRCHQYLPLAEFTRGPRCRPCASARTHEQRVEKVYGITGTEYQLLLHIQDGRCGICRTRPRRIRLAVDHDHKTGSVRGLLCPRCNHKLLGAAHDSIEMLMRAVRYLRYPPAVTGRPVPDDEREAA